jgi:uncharacterized membrane protein
MKLVTGMTAGQNSNTEAAMRRFANSQGTILLYGLVFWLPVAIIVYILFLLFSGIEGVGKSFLLAVLPDTMVHTGFGIGLFIIIVYISGILLKLTGIRGLFSRIPVVGLFFGAGEIMTIDRLSHLCPCLFLFSPTCVSYGWILSEEKISIDEARSSLTLVNVYFPNVPTLVTGSVFPARRETIIRLGNSSKEIVDLLLYAFRSPAELKYLPWEDESVEDFEKRAKAYGLNLHPVGGTTGST